MNPELPASPSTPTRTRPGEQIRNILFTILYWLELGLAASTAVIILVGASYLFNLLAREGMPDKLSDFCTMFEDVLSALLLLLVGVSLAIMLLLRRPESVVEIMFFVLARKILVTSHHIYELLFAVAALAALFATKKYLMTRDAPLLPTLRRRPAAPADDAEPAPQEPPVSPAAGPPVP